MSEPISTISLDLPAEGSLRDSGAPDAKTVRGIARRKPHMFIAVFATWGVLLAWFLPRLLSLLDAAQGPVSWLALAYFVFFVLIAWLYGIYNIAVVTFAAIYRRWHSAATTGEVLIPTKPVAVLYTTCNDFVERGAWSCAELDYANHTVYILDDSTDPEYMRRIDVFAARFKGIVHVIRRPNRQGFKAGNINYALERFVREPFFVIADADEVLPRDFLRRLVPRIEADAQCGFIQANHRCAREHGNKLKHDMRKGIDVHWKWYQPLRNRYGFVMFLGHGALLRRSCWDQVGGFPEVVSEDLAYAIAIREHGYYGQFAEDVTCLEEFPDTVRAFRTRHVKWTRGTCEFLHHYWKHLIGSRRISLPEKLDILFPTVNLPLTFFFFLFMVNMGLVLPLTIGTYGQLTIEMGDGAFLLPVLQMPVEMTRLYTWDFYSVTLATVLAPVLCFIVEMHRTPFRLFRFLSHSTALYASLSPLSAVCVIGYALTGKARFLITGDKESQSTAVRVESQRWSLRRFLEETHPGSRGVRAFEVIAAVAFFVAALVSFQVALLGLSIGYALLVVMHSHDWGAPGLRLLVWMPFSLILAGIALGGVSLFGVQTVFFGFGFHF